MENLAGKGELTGVIDLTTSELTDLLTGGVYSAGDGRLRSAGAAGIPQVVVPGAIAAICADRVMKTPAEIAPAPPGPT